MGDCPERGRVALTGTGDLGQRAARLVWACEANGWERVTWTEAAKALRLDRVKFRSAARAYKARNPDEFKRAAPVLTATEGVTPESTLPDPDEVFERACNEWDRTKRLTELRARQRLEFDHGPIALVNTADWHLGGAGVDYPRLDAELRIIADTPGMYAIGAGDLLNQMIVGRLLDARKNDRLSIRDEWALLRRELAIIAPKLLAVVSGNHDNWAEALTGISYFERELHDWQPRALFDTDDARIVVQVGSWEVPVRIRHQWQGSSIYNPTHGIERAVKWDHDFLIGMGAHTHVSGLAREFSVDGITGMALMAGAYKRVDAYARKGGFPHPNNSTSVAVVINDHRHSLTGYGDLQTCADYMEEMYE